MNENKIMLTDEQMANFTAKGYIKLDSVIPEEINKIKKKLSLVDIKSLELL